MSTCAPQPTWALESARRHPDRTALIGSQGAWSYEELARRVEHFAGHLITHGTRPGHRVAVAMAGDLGFVALLHACQRIGATFVPLNLRLSAHEWRTQLTRLQPSLLLCDSEHFTAANTAATAAPGMRLSTLEKLTEGHPASLDSAPRLRPAASVHAIVFTSGTTSGPKAVPLTLANFRATADAGARALGPGVFQRWLAALPLFHVGGLAILVRAAILGTTVVLQRGFAVDPFADALRCHEITGTSLVATMLSRLLDAPISTAPFPSLRCALVGGGPLDETLAARARARDFPIAATYGMTETASQVATALPGQSRRGPGHVGRPLPRVEVRIDSPDSEGRGEILLRGPQIMPGYLDQPRSTDPRAREGWFPTADLGRLDRDGHLYVEGRIDDLILTGGENVSPSEVEDRLLAHPGVLDAGVRGFPDPHWGQRIKAYIVLATTLDRATEVLTAWCREELGGYKIPRDFHFVASLPRTASGKLERRRLGKEEGG